MGSVLLLLCSFQIWFKVAPCQVPDPGFQGRMEDLAANPPPPALVETKRGPKTPKRSTSSRKDEPSRSRSRSKSTNKQHVQKEPTDEEISQSFLPEYQHLLDVLPHSLYPRSCKHGNHSYTQCLV